MKNISKKLLLILLSINTGFVVGVSAVLGVLFLLEYSKISIPISGIAMGHIDFYLIKIICGLFGVLTFIYLNKQIFSLYPDLGLANLFTNHLRVYSLFTVLSTALFIWAINDVSHSYLSMLYQVVCDWQDSLPPHLP
jgi:hypothetical protein